MPGSLSLHFPHYWNLYLMLIQSDYLLSDEYAAFYLKLITVFQQMQMEEQNK